MRKFKKFIHFITGVTLIRYIKRRIKLNQELKIIQSFPKVNHACIISNNLTIKTVPIKMDGHLLGSFKIELNKNYNDLNIVNLTGAVYILNRKRHSVYHHPHIWASRSYPTNTTFCLGNISDFVKRLYREKEYSTVILLLIQFLEEGYGWQEWDKKECLSHWPKA